jgi:hypothetical protein
MSKLREMYKDPRDESKFPGPYRPKDTMIVIAGPDEYDEDDGGPGPTMPDQEKDMVRISRKEYDDLCRRAAM